MSQMRYSIGRNASETVKGEDGDGLIWGVEMRSGRLNGMERKGEPGNAIANER
jgi:hypothetical protein